MAIAMSSQGVHAVAEFGGLLKEMLGRATTIHQTNSIEHHLSKSDIADLIGQIESTLPPALTPELKKRNQYASIEIAVRNTFNTLLASTSIDTPEFIEVWHLLDIVCTLSDDEQCDPALLFWLVEELLDSQTIAGCRKVFDYLESRRERITAKHFSQKNLAVLRSCNELLRRLSRAEDTTFCGRVFIFLFQSFPLGDKSSVNLRGEYHTENVTTFDSTPSDAERMDVDPEPNSDATPVTPNAILAVAKSNEEPSTTSKGVTFSKAEKSMTASELYPTFWSMQQYFNQPKKLFDQANFATFKSGLEAIMVMFKSVQMESSGRPVRLTEEAKRGTKRKRSQGGDDLANSFNPKYLTSRDLFELEISDLSFRRNILVQVLIVVDFLLSLSTKAKEKLSRAPLPDNPNKSVIYADQTLSEEDAKWAIETKKSIADYLKQGIEGPFFYRMVETVLSRDKNWARWKIESCPSIAKPPITPSEFVEAKSAAKRTTTNKRLRPNPLGSLDLKFLAEGTGQTGLDRLKDPKRYELPSIKSFQSKIELDDMDIDMARDDEAKTAAVEAKASKSWRVLRIATGSKFASFDKIERSDKIDEIFQDPKIEEPSATAEEEDIDEVQFPKDRRPIVISGPSGVGKGTLVTMLLDNHGKALGKKASHTTRTAREGEVHGQHYYFVTKEEYDIMRDGDEFLEFNNFNGNDYGTSRKVVERIIAQGKIPIMEMDMHGIPQLKDAGYSARFIFLAPPDEVELEKRLRQRGLDSDDKIQQRLKIAKQELEQAKTEGFHDVTFINDDLDSTYKKLEAYIFGTVDGEEVSTDAEVQEYPNDETKDEAMEESNEEIEEEAAGEVPGEGEGEHKILPTEVRAASDQPDATSMETDEAPKSDK